MTRIRRWPYTFAMLLSIAVAMIALASSIHLGRPLRDPDGFLGPAYIRLPLLALLFFGGGVFIDAVRTSGWKHLPTGMLNVVKNEWSLRRALCITAGMLSFYICYVSYRNLKSDLPIYRDDVLFDQQLSQSDLWLAGGINPAVFLHDLFGTGFMAEVLSFVYLAYLPLIPISLGAALILSRNLAIGAWYATTLSLNWVLGTVSYYILPALGPAFARPGLYDSLTETGVSDLQDALINTRLDYLADPIGSGEIQGVAAFASLHVSVTFAAALFMMYTRQKPLFQALTWIFFGLTVLATLYFGWHYIVDDIAGMAIGWVSVALGAWVTGNGRRRPRPLALLREADRRQESALAETA
ncbi:PAP2 superfamily protein [Brevibacterium sandarakinum]|uniref:PAP2 superfamily protein n=1 Tax=Brevibacterium sandarakinum TaxID=629680 RepID=A0A1H1TJV9_BRESA|nr:phosphatase PAP2 family protein [Brevibacterium sandarakinum]SDS60256.1 PAP2 superfamily protein [Brevibacterium sandarakinum]